MVAKKKPTENAAVAASDAAPKKGGWAKGKTAPQTSAASAPAADDQEFDPSRIAGSLNGGRASVIQATDAENAAFEASSSEIAAQTGRPSTEQQASEAAAQAATQTEAPKSAAKTRAKGKSDPSKLSEGIVDSNTAKELVGIVESVERLIEEKAGVSDDIREKLGYAKGLGYSTATIRRLIALRAQDPEKRRLMQAELETYANAVGMDL